MKAGDRLEDKTEGTIFLVILGDIFQKEISHVKG